MKQLDVLASRYRSVVSHGQNQKRQVYSVILLIRVIVCFKRNIGRTLFLLDLGVGHDLLDEVVVVDQTVQVLHAVQQERNLVVGQLLAQVHHDVTQLSGRD